MTAGGAPGAFRTPEDRWRRTVERRGRPSKLTVVRLLRDFGFEELGPESRTAIATRLAAVGLAADPPMDKVGADGVVTVYPTATASPPATPSQPAPPASATVAPRVPSAAVEPHVPVAPESVDQGAETGLDDPEGEELIEALGAAEREFMASQARVRQAAERIAVAEQALAEAQAENEHLRTARSEDDRLRFEQGTRLVAAEAEVERLSAEHAELVAGHEAEKARLGAEHRQAVAAEHAEIERLQRENQKLTERLAKVIDFARKARKVISGQRRLANDQGTDLTQMVRVAAATEADLREASALLRRPPKDWVKAQPKDDDEDEPLDVAEPEIEPEDDAGSAPPDVPAPPDEAGEAAAAPVADEAGEAPVAAEQFIVSPTEDTGVAPAAAADGGQKRGESTCAVCGRPTTGNAEELARAGWAVSDQGSTGLPSLRQRGLALGTGHIQAVPAAGEAGARGLSGTVSQLAGIPFVDLARQHAPLQAEIRGAIEQVTLRGDFILGESLSRFESEFAEYLESSTPWASGRVPPR